MPTPTRHLLLGCAIALGALASGVTAGPEPLPTNAGTQPSTAPPAPTGNGEAPTAPQGDQPAQGDGETPDGAPTEAAAPPGPSGEVYALARWVRAIHARICTGPKILPGDRVSLPDVKDQTQGWRVSVPSFAMAHISAPPARARPAPAKAEQPGTPTEPVQTAAEPTDN